MATAIVAALKAKTRSSTAEAAAAARFFGFLLATTSPELVQLVHGASLWVPRPYRSDHCRERTRGYSLTAQATGKRLKRYGWLHCHRGGCMRTVCTVVLLRRT